MYSSNQIRITGISLLSLLFVITSHITVAQQQNSASTQEEVLIDPLAFDLFISVSQQVDADEKTLYLKELNHFVTKMLRKQKRYSSDERFLKYLFYKVHRQYLKHYAKNTDLHELMDKGRYDCITGTAFYAMILDALGYQYKVGELPYHVFLMVELKNGQDSVLLESTDSQSGFVADYKKIKERMAWYAQDVKAEQPNQYNYTFEINERIQITELAGLNYYNEAVQHYNQQHLGQASLLLRQAQTLYPARRMQALQSLIDKVASRQMAAARD